MTRAFDWDTHCTFEEYEWLEIYCLARLRGFLHPRARRQPDGSYQFMSGMSIDELFGIRDEIRAGGWTFLATTRKRHYFRKNGDLFDNPSLCGRHTLGFYTRLDHDLEDDNKCTICLRKWRKMKIHQVFSRWYTGGWTQPRKGQKRHFFGMSGTILENQSICGKSTLRINVLLDQDNENPANCAACKSKFRQLQVNTKTW